MTIYTSRFPDIDVVERSITETVFAGLAAAPDRVVLVDGPSGRSMTGAQVIQGVKALAGGIAARGIGPGDCVAIMSPNLPEFPLVFHAVAWAGATVTTVNPTYTAQELNYQLRDSGARMLVTVAPFLETAREAVDGTGVTEIVVIGTAEGVTPLSALMGTPLEAQVPVGFDDVVALPYSSGTTGLPKGVMLTHENLVVNIAQIIGCVGSVREETTVAFLPFFHIYGLEVLANTYLAGGGTLVTMPRFDLEQFLSLAAAHRTPRLWIAPPVAVALAKHPLVDGHDMSAVRNVVSAAAPLGGDVAEMVAARLNCVVTQGYGMTELSPATHLVPASMPRTGAVGLTAPRTECRIVDPDTLEDAAPGAEGELWVRGPQVMKGYLNNPAATAATITPEGWLRTGDVARFDDDAYLYITDRLKELVKVKGFQVAPAELEALLLTMPQIADAAVIGVPDDEAGEVPMAFVVPVAGAAPDLAAVQAFLGPHVAHYKQVRRLETVETIPKSASGKILRRVLRDRLAAG